MLIWIILGIIVLGFLVYVVTRKTVEANDFLSVLNEGEWLSSENIRERLKRDRNLHVSQDAAYIILRQLKEENLIEFRDIRDVDATGKTSPVREYKLSLFGAKIKDRKL